MLRLLSLLFFIFPLFAEEIPKRCSSSVNCKSCHSHIVKDWQRSWHAKSHASSNEYYRKTLEYVAQKRYKNVDIIQLECTACHSPRIGITKIDQSESLAHAFGMEDVNTELGQAIEAETLKEGINCIVCHKIEAIHSEKDTTLRGNNMLTWLKAGVIGGPYKDSASSFHKSTQQRFFNNPDKLCLVCHDNMKNSLGLTIADTGSEYRSIAKKKLCVDCHMSEKQDGYAALVPDTNGVKKKRKIRRHLFAGGHSKKSLRNALTVSTKEEGQKLFVTLHNPNPHAIPTGFGGREIIVEVKYKNGYSKMQSLTAHYKSRRGRPTIPHLAKKQDTSEHIKAMDKKVLEFITDKDTKPVEVMVWFKLVNDEIADILQLKEKQWQEKKLIVRQNIK